MKREYHKWWSERLGREMELLVFGHDGLPAVVFPTSQGRFFEFEDRGMVDAVRDNIEGGRLQLFCVDSVDAESWYNRQISPRWRVARHLQYESYIVEEVLPLIRGMNGGAHLATVGCSFGGYHAVNIALRYPDKFSGFLSMGGAFDLPRLGFLNGYHDNDVYMSQPTQYIPNMHDSWYLDRYRQNTYVLATGVHDQCWNDNGQLARILRDKGVPVLLDVWGDDTGHDWPWWQRMAQKFL
ncbi:MAG TPA: alpha/beta fold hydrolase [Acidobacteriaceae bacterium]